MPNLAYPFDDVPWPDERFYRDAPTWAASGVIGSMQNSYSGGPLALSFAVAGSVITPTLALGRARVRGTLYERTDAPWTTGLGGTQPYDGSAAYVKNANTLPRVDRLVLRRDKAAAKAYPVILQGAPAASPTPPALTRSETGVYDLPLYRWQLAGNNSTAVSDIVDERTWLSPDGYGPVITPWNAPSFVSEAQRDVAYNAYVAAGGPLTAGMRCTVGNREYLRGSTTWAAQPRHHGSGTTFPNAPVNGDTYDHDTYRCTMRFTGSTAFWRQADITEVTSDADRFAFVQSLAAASLQMHNGFQVFQQNTDDLWNSPGGISLRPASGAATVANRAARESYNAHNGDHVYQQDIATELVFKGNHWELAKSQRIFTNSTTGTTYTPQLQWQGYQDFGWVPNLGDKSFNNADGIARFWEVTGTAHIVGDMLMRIRVDVPGVGISYFPSAAGTRITAPANTEQTWVAFGTHYQAPEHGANFYLEARAFTQGSGGVIAPQLSLVAH